MAYRRVQLGFSFSVSLSLSFSFSLSFFSCICCRCAGRAFSIACTWKVEFVWILLYIRVSTFTCGHCNFFLYLIFDAVVRYRLLIYTVSMLIVRTSSATAMSTNSNCCLVATVRTRWSRMCSSVAAISISFAPFAMRFNTMSIKQYVPVRPAPSLSFKNYYNSAVGRRQENRALSNYGMYYPTFVPSRVAIVDSQLKQ